MPTIPSAITSVRAVRIVTPTAVLDALLGMPARAHGLVIIGNGSGDATYVQGNNHVGARLRESGFATLFVNLFNPSEMIEDAETSRLRFELPLLASRLLAVARWASAHPVLAGLPIGMFASGTCGGATLLAAAQDRDGLIASVVSRAGRAELAMRSLKAVRVPVMLLVGELDVANVTSTTSVLPLLPYGSRVQIIPDARHALEDGEALERTVQLTRAWFELSAAGESERYLTIAR
jgi:putative phosphoribosyl transferase